MNRERSYSAILADHHGEELGRFGDYFDRKKHQKFQALYEEN